jgi:Cu+-exporting ATPase
MDVEAANDAAHSEHKGTTYHFCGSKCKEKFDLNPEQYVSKAEATHK